MCRKKKLNTQTINMTELLLKHRKFDTQEIGRGVGIHLPKKGKGSYKRKLKHRRVNNED